MTVTRSTSGHTATITLSSDDGLNRLSLAMLRDLAAGLHECDQDPHVRGVVLASEGRTFSAGADIDEFPYGQDAHAFLHQVLDLLSTPERIGKPVVAAIERSAVAGGFELALACDWIVAGADARLGLPEVQFGFVPGYSLRTLPHLIGEARARRLMLDPGPFRPAELAALGIHISAPDAGTSVLAAAVEVCERMQVGAPKSVRLVKAMTNRFARSPDFEPVIAGYQYLFQIPEAQEGLAAFREGRQADFWSR